MAGRARRMGRASDAYRIFDGMADLLLGGIASV